MADKVIKMDMSYAEAGDVTGKVVNVYDTYAHALAHGATGLVATLKAVNPLTGAVSGGAITQVAKKTGVNVDANGKLLCSLSDASAEYWGAMEAGRQVGPFRISLA